MNFNKKDTDFRIIIQVRYNSTRLRGKILKKINNIEILKIMIERIEKLPRFKKKIIINISKKNSSKIEKFCKKNNLKYFIGSDSNVLKRYFDCATKYKVNNIIRIPSDCPLIDPKIIEKGLKLYQNNNYSYVTNLCPATYVDGNDVEIIDYKTLKKIKDESKTSFDKEHVTTYLRNRLNQFKYKNFQSNKNLSKTYRLTVDFKEDFLLIKMIVLKLGIYANYTKIINFLKKNKKLSSINKKHIGEMWYQKNF
jgi:spore coat polysaccharide biosynthesis protein SpsF